MTQGQDGRAPTVGDTLTVVHRVAVPAGSLVEARGPTDSTLATLVGVPDVRREGDSVRIAYTIAVWAPGRHQLTIPGAVVVAADGQIDTLPDVSVSLHVASMLPPRTAIESIAPRAARPWMARSDASPLPFAVFLPPLALLLIAAALWWRRRGPLGALPAAARVDRDAQAERIARWVAAGEVAVAVDHLLAMLPDDEAAAAWRDRARLLRYDPARRVDLADVAREGLALLGRGGR